MSVDLHVIGTGLIGTSIGLAVADAWDVLLSDRSPSAVDVAVARGAGRPWDGREKARLVVVAVPPAALRATLESAQRADLATTYSHVSSVQSRLQPQVQPSGLQWSTLCGGHPLAGKERSGPHAAAADLFVGRPWVLCPSAHTTQTAVREVHRLVLACGGQPLTATAEEHDAAVALVSHLPQVAASAVAALLVRTSPSGGLAPAGLAGPGLQDTTRIAASNPELWLDVLTQNAAHVAPLVQALAADLAQLAQALAETAQGGGPAAREVVLDLLRRGNAGRSLVPFKPGGADRDLVLLSVSISDHPGQLAAVLNSAASAAVNVEDVRLEHLPGRPRGVVALLVRSQDLPAAGAALRADGWLVEPAP